MFGTYGQGGFFLLHLLDHPEAKRWFGQFVESGYDGAKRRYG
jgi:hypothetical protein